MPILKKKSLAELLSKNSENSGGEEKDDMTGSIAGLMKAMWENKGKSEDQIGADENYLNKFENTNALRAGEQESPDNEWGLDKSDNSAMSGDLGKLSKFAQDALAVKNKDVMDTSGVDLSNDESNWDNYRKKLFKRQTL